MKRIFRLFGLTTLVITILLATIAGVVLADSDGYMEPAPNSGDGNPDGSGFDGDVGSGPGPAPNSGDGNPDGSGFEDDMGPRPGPAPNSGDGIPDGSGF